LRKLTLLFSFLIFPFLTDAAHAQTTAEPENSDQDTTDSATVDNQPTEDSTKTVKDTQPVVTKSATATAKTVPPDDASQITGVTTPPLKPVPPPAQPAAAVPTPAPKPMLLNQPLHSSPESNFVDTRISFIFGDDDFLHKAGETIVDSPLPGFGNRDGYELFFDNLNSARTGRENQLHLVLYKKLAGYIPGIVTEGAIVTKYDFSSARDGNLEDDGTYLLIRHKSPNNSELSLTMFPVSTDRFRLGYLYDLTWAGASSFPDSYRRLTPGIKFAYQSKNTYGFAGFKTARMLTNPPPEENLGREMETFYAALAGFGHQMGKFKFEANGGFVQMGQNPNNGVKGESVQLFGVSSRLSFLNGMRIGTSADLRLYRNDPAFVRSITRKPNYTPGFYYLFSVEGNYLMQTLEDPDNYGDTILQPAYAGAFNFKFRKNFLRGHFTVFSRSVSFILRNVPSYIPYQALSEDLDTTPEVFAAAGIDYFIPSLHLTLGMTLGFQMPANSQVKLSASTGSSQVDYGVRTLVIRDEGQISVLPNGEEALPIFGTKLSATLRLSDMMTISLMVLYQNDPNFTTLKTLDNNTSARVFEDSHKFGAAIVTSAKF
jgi:hypothetical protein